VADRRAEVGVLGVGAMGSMALWRLAKRGIRCVGFEQFQPGHDRGSSTGDTRIFRTAYFEGAGYVPLLLAAAPLWRALEAETDQHLLTLTGALMIGPQRAAVVRGARRSAERHGLPHELLDPADLRRRHPHHVIANDDMALLDPQAGFLRPEPAVVAAAARAQALGAELVTATRVQAVEPSGGGFLVRTREDAWRVERLILAAGAWNPRWTPGLPLAVERVVQTWFAVDEPADFSPGRFPVFIRQLDDGFSRYGIPSTDGATIKVAGHGGGGPADPDRLERDSGEADWRLTAGYVEGYLTGVATEPALARVCMYTNSPDQHFVIGQPPDLPGSFLISACSGHGFKFAPVLGEVAAAAVTGETVPFDLEPFSPRRFVPVP
jgi:sarcosine oxidase